MANEFLCFIILCWNFYSSSADITKVRLTIAMELGEKTCKEGDPLDIELGQQFQLFVDSSREHYFHSAGRCKKSLESHELVDTIFRKVNESKIYTSDKVDATQLGIWDYGCIFFTNKCDTINKKNKCHYTDKHGYTDNGVKCFIKVNVHKKGEKVEKPNGFLTVNGVNVSTTDGQYKFYLRKNVNFTCHKSTGSYVKLSLHTANQAEQISTEFLQTASVSIYKQLKTNYDNAILTCHITNAKHTLESVIKLILMMDEGSRENINFEVNESILPRIRETGNKYYYEYKYYDGEKVSVNVNKDSDYGNVKCSGNGSEKLTSFFKGGSKSLASFVLVLNKNETGASINCSVLNTKDSIEYHVYLTFLFHSLDYSPYIIGLPMSNVLLQYSNTTSNIIEYSIARDEKLHLVCIAYGQKNTTTTYNPGDAISQTKDDQGSIILPLDRNNAIITCQVNSSKNDKITYLELSHDSRKKIAPTTAPINTTTPAATTTPVATTTSPALTTPPPTQGTTANTATTTEATIREFSTTLQEDTTTSSTTTPTISTTTSQPTVSQSREPKALKNWKTTVKPRANNEKKTTKKSKPRYSTTTKKTVPPSKPTVKVTTTRGPRTSSPPLQKGEQANSLNSSLVEQAQKPSNTTVPVTGPSTIAPDVPDNGSLEKIIDECGAWFIACAVVLVLFVITFVLWIALKKKKKILKHSSSYMDYQNLPEHHEGPMATPPQWNRSDDVLYANLNSADNLYAKPTPKNQRNKLEPTYAEPKDSIAHHTYINTQEINDEPTYALVQENDPTYALAQNNEPTYASIQKNDATYASVQKNEPTYASVQKSTRASNQPDPTYSNQNTVEYQYANTLKIADKHANTKKTLDRKSKKTNGKGSKEKINDQGKTVNDVIYADICTEISGNNKYVNANVKNSIEPTYCEVIKK